MAWQSTSAKPDIPKGGGYPAGIRDKIAEKRQLHENWQTTRLL